MALQDEIIADLTAELSATEENLFNADILAIKVKNAIRDVKMRRNYGATSWSDEKIEQDLYDNYYSTITDIARYDYNQLGAEGSKSRSENSTSETWVDRDTLFRGVHAFVAVL